MSETEDFIELWILRMKEELAQIEALIKEKRPRNWRELKARLKK